MATFYGANATLSLNQVPTGKVPAGESGGRVRLLFDTYTIAADFATLDIIKMGDKVPAGARVVDAWLAYDDLDTSGGTLDFGWAASADAVVAADATGFISAADATNADVIKMTDNGAKATGQGKSFASAVQPQVRIQGDTDVTSGVIQSYVFYVLD